MGAPFRRPLRRHHDPVCQALILFRCSTPSDLGLAEDFCKPVQLLAQDVPFTLHVAAHLMPGQSPVDILTGGERRSQIPAGPIEIPVCIPGVPQPVHGVLQPGGFPVELILATCPIQSASIQGTLQGLPELVRSLFAVGDDACNPLSSLVVVPAITPSAPIASIALCVKSKRKHERRQDCCDSDDFHIAPPEGSFGEPLSSFYSSYSRPIPVPRKLGRSLTRSAGRSPG